MRGLGPSVVAGAALIAALIVTPALSEPASEPVQISEMGPPGDGRFDADGVRLAFGPNGGLAVYGGEPTALDEDGEMYGRRIDASGLPVGEQIRITTVGTDGQPEGDARNVSVAYNSTTNEYLAVWGNSPPEDVFDEQIKARRISAAGALLGSVLPVSQLAGSGAGDNQRARVAYASGANEYLVVWRDNFTNAVYGQRLAGATGAEVGTSDFLISAAGTDPERMDVTYNPDRDEFLVVWNDDTASDGEEIFGRRVEAGGTGALLGEEMQLSEVGPAGDSNFEADRPAVAYSTATQEYLVGWHGDHFPTSDEQEVFAQRVSGAGVEVGDDLRISTQGSDGDTNFDAERFSAAWDLAAGRWLVTWEGTASHTDTGGSETEIFARRLGADGAPDGDPFRLTTQGPDGDPAFTAEQPVSAFSASLGQMIVLWHGTRAIDESQVDEDDRNELEIFARRERQPVPAATATPAPSPTPTATPGPVALTPADVFALPKRCVKRRRLKFRILAPVGAVIDRVVVRVNRKKVRTVRGDALAKPVKLRKLPRKRFTLKLKATTTDGRSVSIKRRYKACKKKARR